MDVSVSDDLTITIGDEAVQLKPREAFRLAERLIDRAAIRMVTDAAMRAPGFTALLAQQPPEPSSPMCPPYGTDAAGVKEP